MALTLFQDRFVINDAPQAMLMCYQCHKEIGIVDVNELRHLSHKHGPPTVCFECENVACEKCGQQHGKVRFIVSRNAQLCTICALEEISEEVPLLVM